MLTNQEDEFALLQIEIAKADGFARNVEFCCQPFIHDGPREIFGPVVILHCFEADGVDRGVDILLGSSQFCIGQTPVGLPGPILASDPRVAIAADVIMLVRENGLGRIKLTTGHPQSGLVAIRAENLVAHSTLQFQNSSAWTGAKSSP